MLSGFLLRAIPKLAVLSKYGTILNTALMVPAGNHPWVQQAHPHLQRWQMQVNSALSPHWARYQPYFDEQAAWVDSQLAQYRPWQLVLVTVLASFILYSCLSVMASFISSIQDAGDSVNLFYMSV